MVLPNVKINRRSFVFVDTSALVAILVNSDLLHRDAVQLMAELREKEAQIVTTEMIFFELANSLSAIRYRNTAIGLIDQLRQMNNLEIMWSNPDLFESATDMYRTRPDKEWSLTDCASFVVMNDRNISIAFTADKHFEQAGFVKRLAN